MMYAVSRIVLVIYVRRLSILNYNGKIILIIAENCDLTLQIKHVR